MAGEPQYSVTVALRQGEPTPEQAAAWRRLAARLLQPAPPIPFPAAVDSQAQGRDTGAKI